MGHLAVLVLFFGGSYCFNTTIPSENTSYPGTGFPTPDIQTTTASLRPTTPNHDHLEESIDELWAEINDLKNKNLELEEKINVLENAITQPVQTPASCQEYYDKGERTNGTYNIQPVLSMDVFNVTCIFIGNIGQTILDHSYGNRQQITSTPLDSDGCADPGCYTDTIIYDATVEQIEALMQISSQCEQLIYHNCSVNVLTKYSWWVDRTGQKVSYWHGDKKRTAIGCACSDTDSCTSTHGHMTSCNCDSRDRFNVDLGLLTSMEQLPVMELAFGDSLNRYSWIWYRLGKFKCSGKRSVYPSEEGGTDFAFKAAAGNSQYIIQQGSILYFTDLIYDHTMSSLSNGVFNAPADGTYLFTLHLTTNYFYRYTIGIYVNDEIVDYACDNTDYSTTSSGYFKTTESVSEILLKRHDRVYYKTIESYYNLASKTGCATHGRRHDCSWFSGKLIRRSL